MARWRGEAGLKGLAENLENLGIFQKAVEFFGAVATSDSDDIFGGVEGGRSEKRRGFWGGIGFGRGRWGGAIGTGRPSEGGLARGIDAEEPGAVVGDQRVAVEAEATGGVFARGEDE